jgi:site-specific DNA-cytosine methylase
MAGKVILDLCGGSGSWSKPWRDAGYDVRVLTLPEYDITQTRCREPYYGIELPLYGYEDGAVERIRYEDICGILAAPPCTEFSIAKSTAPRDLAAGMRIVRACLDVIWHCQIHGRLKFWALENPKGLLVRFLGKPAFKFEQWQFGGTLEKPTYLWGQFDAPKPTVAEKPHIEKFYNNVNRNMNSREYGSPKCPEEYEQYVAGFTGYKEKRAAIRAITPAGFAEAFYKANKLTEVRS